MTEIKLGKIQSVQIGLGGYQEAQFGISFTLGNEGWGVADFWGMWASWDKHCKWTKKDQINDFGKTDLRIIKLLKQAKVNNVADLKGIPIELIFERRTLKSWRILMEVL